MAIVWHLLTLVILSSVNTGNPTDVDSAGDFDKDLPQNDFDKIPIGTGDISHDKPEPAKLGEHDSNEPTDELRNGEEGVASDQSELDTEDDTEPSMQDEPDLSQDNVDEFATDDKEEKSDQLSDDASVRTIDEPEDDDESKLTGRDESELTRPATDDSDLQKDAAKTADDDLSEDLLVRTIHQARQETEEEEKRARSTQSLDELLPKNIQEQHYKRYMPRLEPARIEALVREKTTRMLAEKLRVSPTQVARKLVKWSKGNFWWHLYKPRKKLQCKIADIYRSITGYCNNLYRPLYGAADRPFIRLLKPAYADGISTPRIASGKDRLPLPNARKVSRTLFKQFNRPSRKLSHMAMIWGQIIDHDITLGAQPNIECPTTNCKGLQGECFSIEIPPGDSVFKQCIIVKRDSPFPVPLGKPRKQFSARSAFIDASMVYGDEPKIFDSLRDKSDKKLLLLRKKSPSGLLPPLRRGDPEDFCRNPNVQLHPCFRAGDVRPNENSGLASLHTIWAREHNRIAKILASYKLWDDDEVFFETRKIVGAMIQHITYNEFLPEILDYRTRRKHGLLLKKSGFFKRYNKKVNPSIIDAFATAAYRFGHSLIQNQLNRFDKSFYPITPAINMSRFFDVSSLYDKRKGGAESILRGLTKDKSQRVDSNFAKAVQDELVRGPDDQADLPAINIQRAREHGTPGYNQYRKLCGLPKAKTFRDFTYKGIMTCSQAKRLAQVYKTPDDVDLFVGSLYEKPVCRGVMGNTFSCIIARQFRLLRFGDRYWYENESGSKASKKRMGTSARTGFTPVQLKEIRKTSLARVLCDNGKGITKMQRWALRQQSPVDCSKIPRVNLSKYVKARLSW